MQEGEWLISRDLTSKQPVNKKSLEAGPIHSILCSILFSSGWSIQGNDLPRMRGVSASHSFVINS